MEDDEGEDEDDEGKMMDARTITVLLLCAGVAGGAAPTVS